MFKLIKTRKKDDQIFNRSVFSPEIAVFPLKTLKTLRYVYQKNENQNSSLLKSEPRRTASNQVEPKWTNGRTGRFNIKNSKSVLEISFKIVLNVIIGTNKKNQAEPPVKPAGPTSKIDKF